jgi:hypothetical protein
LGAAIVAAGAETSNAATTSNPLTGIPPPVWATALAKLARS